MRQDIVLLCCIVATACSNPPAGLLDFCDGLDDDGDGMIDEGTGEEVDCLPLQICVNGVCAANCGDRMCTAANGENCGTCAADCGECPRCGDGTCNPGETCSSCASDCGACPFCGDGRCNNAETCTTCLDDCGLCPGECGPCTASFTCGSGLRCSQRICDGAIGCFSDLPGRGCPVLGGEMCPPVTAYDRCDTNADCGPHLRCDMTTMRCSRLPDFQTFGNACDNAYLNACPPPPNGIAGLDQRCVLDLCEGCIDCSGGPTCPYHCELTCTVSCPYGMTCTDTCGGEVPCVSPNVCR